MMDIPSCRSCSSVVLDGNKLTPWWISGRVAPGRGPVFDTLLMSTGLEVGRVAVHVVRGIDAFGRADVDGPAGGGGFRTELMSFSSFVSTF